MNNPINISDFIREAVKNWGCDVEIINEFDCEEFAKAIIKQFPKAKLYWNNDLPHLFPNCPSYPIHSFVYYNEMYYDAECPNGVKCPTLLPRLKFLTFN